MDFWSCFVSHFGSFENIRLSINMDNALSLTKFQLYLQWATFLDSEGRIMDSKALRKRIFYGGIEHSLRKEVCTL